MSEWISVEDRLPEKQSWNHIAILDTKTGRISVEQDLYAIETAENLSRKKGFAKMEDLTAVKSSLLGCRFLNRR